MYFISCDSIMWLEMPCDKFTGYVNLQSGTSTDAEVGKAIVSNTVGMLKTLPVVGSNVSDTYFHSQLKTEA